MSDPALVVCGFFDEPTGLGALAWSGGEVGGLLAQKGAVNQAEVRIDEAGNGLRLELDSGELGCVAEILPLTEPVALKDPEEADPAGSPRSAICRATVELAGKGKRRIECLGHLTRWESDPAEGAAVARHLAIPGPERTLLVVTAHGETAAEGHSGERARAWLLDAEGGAIAFSEALLSTQYDEAGRQTRAGLELWRGEGEAPPMRAAGTLLGETANGSGLTAALLESSAEGTAGVGGYLIWRP